MVSFDASSSAAPGSAAASAAHSLSAQIVPADRGRQAQEDAGEGKKKKKKIIYIDGGKPRDKHVAVSESPRCHQLCSHTFHNALPPTAAIQVSGQTAIHRSMVDIDSIGRVFTQTKMSTPTAIRHHSSFRQRITTRSPPCIRIRSCPTHGYQLCMCDHRRRCTATTAGEDARYMRVEAE